MANDYEKYIQNFYNINPDALEEELIKVVKAYYIFADLTAEAYVEQLQAKDDVKRIEGSVFIEEKNLGSSDKKCEAKVKASCKVKEVKDDYFAKLRKWEEYRGHKETTSMKHDVLKSMGFNRKKEIDLEE